MTAKEKAIRLVDRFKADTVIYTWDDDGYEVDIETSLQNAKNCALICVDEILEFHDRIDVKYWKEVKQEILKLTSYDSTSTIERMGL
jgi:hypothetical protein